MLMPEVQPNQANSHDTLHYMYSTVRIKNESLFLTGFTPKVNIEHKCYTFLSKSAGNGKSMEKSAGLVACLLKQFVKMRWLTQAKNG